MDGLNTEENLHGTVPSEPDKNEAFVSCTEVKKYLNEISKILGEISQGIAMSLDNMEERVTTKGDTDNG
jgi:hypothetical protein